MNTEWITPQVTVLTTEEAAELANISLACASTLQLEGQSDHC